MLNRREFLSSLAVGATGVASGVSLLGEQAHVEGIFGRYESFRFIEDSPSYISDAFLYGLWGRKEKKTFFYEDLMLQDRINKSIKEIVKPENLHKPWKISKLKPLYEAISSTTEKENYEEDIIKLYRE